MANWFAGRASQAGIAEFGPNPLLSNMFRVDLTTGADVASPR